MAWIIIRPIIIIVVIIDTSSWLQCTHKSFSR